MSTIEAAKCLTTVVLQTLFWAIRALLHTTKWMLVGILHSLLWVVRLLITPLFRKPWRLARSGFRCAWRGFLKGLTIYCKSRDADKDSVSETSDSQGWRLSVKSWIGGLQAVDALGGWMGFVLILLAVGASPFLLPSDLERAFRSAITPLAVLWGVQYFSYRSGGSHQSNELSMTRWENATRLSGILAVGGILIYMVLPRHTIEMGSLHLELRAWLSPLVVLLIGGAVGTAVTATVGRMKQGDTDANDQTPQQQQKQVAEYALMKELSKRYAWTFPIDLVMASVLFGITLWGLLGAGVPLLQWAATKAMDSFFSIKTPMWMQESWQSALGEVIQQHMGTNALLFSLLGVLFLWLALYQFLSLRKGNWVWRWLDIKVVKESEPDNEPDTRSALIRAVLSPYNWSVVPIMFILLGLGFGNASMDARLAAAGLWTSAAVIGLFTELHKGRGINDAVAGTKAVLVEHTRTADPPV